MKIYYDTYDVSIKLKDTDILTKQGLLFKSLDIYEAIMRPIPTCELDIILPASCIEEGYLDDGTKIEITIKSEDARLDEKYEFRLFCIRQLDLQNNLLHVKISGVIDFYDGYTHPNEFNAYSTTSDIFKKISSKFNLKNDVDCIDDTNDKQLWVSNTMPVYNFLSYLAQHGWKDDTSAMIWCIDRQKRLLYKNVTDLFKNKSSDVYKFIMSRYCDIDNHIFSYYEITSSIQSGLNNTRYGGYGESGQVFNLKDYKYKEVSSTKVKLSTESLNLNKELSNGLGENWYDFDMGNNNDNFHKAYVQNNRLLSLYSTYTTLNIQYLQPFRLCQIVDIYHIDIPNEDNEFKLSALSGAALIDAINIHITPGEVSGMIETVSQGLNCNCKDKGTY